MLMRPGSPAGAADPGEVPPTHRSAREIRITGLVQGVGFRPFVHRLARRLGLAGSARNESGAVAVWIEGPDEQVHSFLAELPNAVPPLARIDRLTSHPAAPRGDVDFCVEPSRIQSGQRVPVSPDVAPCLTCYDELRDPANRRFGHSFITCTDCGPRYAIAYAMPYDRQRTSMSRFDMCRQCETEYRDPDDRRYHSETNACRVCGPRLWLETPARPQHATAAPRSDPIRAAAALLCSGRIVAVRGVGGFHLAADATDEDVVARLRRGKLRDDKPLAVLVPSLEQARALAILEPAAAELLERPERPIVLVPRLQESPLARSVAPGLNTVGLMLPSCPHQMMLAECATRPLVFTSGNPSDEPLAAGVDEARARLGDIADAFVMHDRDIVSRIDDSVLKVVDGVPLMLRRARGYAPLPVTSPVPTPRPILAVGGHLKNTFALAIDDQVYLSPHIGTLDSFETMEHFERTLGRFRGLFDVDPEIVARDLHPGYMSSRLATRLAIQSPIPVQHHHGHVAAVAAEHGMTGPVLGIAFDGTGYGEDGRVWGAEFLVADLVRSRRVGHLRYAPLPGGDLAARSPWRAAAGFFSLSPEVREVGLAFRGVPDGERTLVQQQIVARVNSPEWSSMGRLFDAAAAVLGVRTESTYEGQAAIELEALAGDLDPISLPFDWTDGPDGRLLEPVPLLRALAARVTAGDDRARLAAGFHEAVAKATAGLGAVLCDENGLSTVALGGGCFQNARLLSSVRRRLERLGLTVLVPRQLSPNDSALSYGQAVVAAARLAEGRN